MCVTRKIRKIHKKIFFHTTAVPLRAWSILWKSQRDRAFCLQRSCAFHRSLLVTPKCFHRKFSFLNPLKMRPKTLEKDVEQAPSNLRSAPGFLLPPTQRPLMKLSFKEQEADERKAQLARWSHPQRGPRRWLKRGRHQSCCAGSCDCVGARNSWWCQGCQRAWRDDRWRLLQQLSKR